MTVRHPREMPLKNNWSKTTAAEHGSCPVCKMPVVPGQQIAKQRHTKTVVHLGCAPRTM